MVTPSSAASVKSDSAMRPGSGVWRKITSRAGAVQRAPVAHPPLQRPPDAVVGEGVGIGHLQMAQERDRLHGGVALQDRQQHRLPHRGERIGNGAAALGLALRRQAGIGVDPACRCAR